MGAEKTDTKEVAITQREEKTAEPPMYKVLLHNDDYTTKEFVVYILVTIFHKTIEEATLLMLNVHKNGIGVVGVYPYEIAETKVNQVKTLALENDYPLKTSLERE